MSIQKLSDTVYRPEDLKSLSESAYKKCLDYFLSLNFSETKSESKKQKELQEHLRNWTWKLIYYVYTSAPTHFFPQVNFFVEIEWIEMPALLEPELAEEKDDLKNALMARLSEDEIYALIHTQIERHVQDFESGVMNSVANLTLDQRRNQDHTEIDIDVMDRENTWIGLRLLQGMTREQIWQIITF